eukprot:TRINITY_DN100737_c0_g1_i1.p1 TRINITY_DN100737_c0_g1~~TRINITY_DN100737_c0_g1_i1.p1  ORF type:complete len:560 (-),score=141.70 TRINITY_DN100737_c0_g1_i1:291-1970(-)
MASAGGWADCFRGLLPCGRNTVAAQKQPLRPCELLSLLRQHPSLVNRATLQHPCKVTKLLRYADVDVISKFCAAVPEEVVTNALVTLFQKMKRDQVETVLAPLFRQPAPLEAMVMLVQRVEAEAVSEVICGVPPGKLDIVLRAPPDKLAGVVSGMDSGRIGPVLLPVLRESDELLEHTLVPLLREVDHPERIATVANQVEEQVLLWILRGEHPKNLANLIDAFGAEDFEPDSHLILLLIELADERGLTKNKVLPLLQKGVPETITTLVRQVKPVQLLQVLRAVEVDGVLRLLENTNIDIIVRLFNGPLETTISSVAGGLAEAMRHPVVASNVRQLTNALNDGIVKTNTLTQKTIQDVKTIVDRGKAERGAGEEEDDYQFGDFTRGLLAEAATRGKEALADASEAAERGREAWEQATGALENVTRDLVKRSTLVGPEASDGQETVDFEKSDKREFEPAHEIEKVGHELSVDGTMSSRCSALKSEKVPFQHLATLDRAALGAKLGEAVDKSRQVVDNVAARWKDVMGAVDRGREAAFTNGFCTRSAAQQQFAASSATEMNF